MKNTFNDYLIIHYPKTKLTNVYKREINKVYHNRYTLETYYRVNKIDKSFKSKFIYNKEQIQMLISVYLEEYGIEKTIFYK